MKFFGFLIFLILAAFTATAVADDETDPEVVSCKQDCLKFPTVPVCGTGKATYWNECEMKCEKAELIHIGECEFEELLDNKVHL